MEITNADENICPMCKQNIQNDTHLHITESLNTELELELKSYNKIKNNIVKLEEDLKNVNSELDIIGEAPSVHYNTINEVYNHKTAVENLQHRLEVEMNSTNTFEEQIQQLESEGLQQISFDHLNNLNSKREHQEFLWKLLTNKDSFIRKKIIDQNLYYLNKRLNHYLEKLGLVHEVRFLNDLSVEITELGREFDFDNLSRGERNRLILGLSFAFRDVWESLNTSINLLCIDELIDSGMDQLGVESSLAVLKNMSRERGKDIFLISHREELMSRVSKLLMVRKEAGFSTFLNTHVES